MNLRSKWMIDSYRSPLMKAGLIRLGMSSILLIERLRGCIGVSRLILWDHPVMVDGSACPLLGMSSVSRISILVLCRPACNSFPASRLALFADSSTFLGPWITPVGDLLCVVPYLISADPRP